MKHNDEFYSIEKNEASKPYRSRRSKRRKISDEEREDKSLVDLTVDSPHKARNNTKKIEVLPFDPLEFLSLPDTPLDSADMDKLLITLSSSDQPSILPKGSQLNYDHVSDIQADEIDDHLSKASIEQNEQTLNFLGQEYNQSIQANNYKEGATGCLQSSLMPAVLELLELSELGQRVDNELDSLQEVLNKTTEEEGEKSLEKVYKGYETRNLPGSPAEKIDLIKKKEASLLRHFQSIKTESCCDYLSKEQQKKIAHKMQSKNPFGPLNNGNLDKLLALISTHAP